MLVKIYPGRSWEKIPRVGVRTLKVMISYPCMTPSITKEEEREFWFCDLIFRAVGSMMFSLFFPLIPYFMQLAFFMFYGAVAMYPFAHLRCHDGCCQQFLPSYRKSVLPCVLWWVLSVATILNSACSYIASSGKASYKVMNAASGCCDSFVNGSSCDPVVSNVFLAMILVWNQHFSATSIYR